MTVERADGDEMRALLEVHHRRGLAGLTFTLVSARECAGEVERFVQ